MILIGQVPFLIPIVHYDQITRILIKFQFVRKQGKPTFLTEDNLRC